MIAVLSVLAGAGTVVSAWLYGNRSVGGAWVGLAAQVPWALLTWETGAWGLWISWAFMTVVHFRNLRRMSASSGR
jgi:hypothetical protein